MLTVHPIMFLEREIYENQYFVEPEIFVSNDKAELLERQILNIKVCVEGWVPLLGGIASFLVSP